MPQTKEQKAAYMKEYREKNKEKIKAKDKEWREKNKGKKAKYMKEWHEQNKDHEKEYREKNKDKLKEQSKKYRDENKDKEKEYREKNKEKKAEYDKKYYEQNPEKIKKRSIEYYRTLEGKRLMVIYRWKRLGLIHDDYDALYDDYLKAENCEECAVQFGEKGDGSGTFKCMDHCHYCGRFRNFLCQKCNFKRQ